MAIIRSPLRPIEVPVSPVKIALQTGVVIAAIALAGLALQQWQQRAQPLPAVTVRPVPVYDATGAMQNAIVPSSSAGLSVKPLPVYDATGAMEAAIASASGSAVRNIYHFVSVDSATASHLAAEHPWTAESAAVETSHQFVTVDGATASQLAAENPWGSAVVVANQ